jgi:hypothetical protein
MFVTLMQLVGFTRRVLETLQLLCSLFIVPIGETLSMELRPLKGPLAIHQMVHE